MRPVFSLAALFLLATATIAQAGCDLTVKQLVQIKLMGGIPLNAVSTQMYPTIPQGTVFFANISGGDEPKPMRGDIVAFCSEQNPKIIYIQRIVGLPGDRLQMVNNEIILNGEKVPHTPDGTGDLDYAHGFPCFRERLADVSYRICQTGPSPLGTMPEMTVPAGRIFLLGDNRDNSVDSRMPRDIGTVPIENIIGIVDLTK